MLKRLEKINPEESKRKTSEAKAKEEAGLYDRDFIIDITVDRLLEELLGVGRGNKAA